MPSHEDFVVVYSETVLDKGLTFDFVTPLSQSREETPRSSCYLSDHLWVFKRSDQPVRRNNSFLKSQ